MLVTDPASCNAIWATVSVLGVKGHMSIVLCLCGHLRPPGNPWMSCLFHILIDDVFLLCLRILIN